jgi:predicted methyltransferase
VSDDARHRGRFPGGISMSRKLCVGLLASVALVLSAAPVVAAVPANITAAVADASRPADDTKRDADRKPAEMLAFTGVKPGDRVADVIPGGGYFSRLFSAAVGPKGAVYGYMPSEFAKFSKTPLPATGTHPDAARPNITSSGPRRTTTTFTTTSPRRPTWRSSTRRCSRR